MGTIVCQTCETTIGHFEDEKVTVLYGSCCSHCNTTEVKHTESHHAHK
ncbi:GapA-binding peptide SR1P [Microbacteriaceae bacterium 4G12]